jgi:uncharacterized protein YbjT (DUF2867 family)
MDVAIAGGHGKIALLLARLLAERGDRVRSLIRNPDHANDVRATGAEPVVHDLERANPPELAEVIAGADAVVFAAGAGPGSGPERKWTVDHGAAAKLIEAAQSAGVRRYVIVSSIGAENPPPESRDDTFSVYLRAKAAADRDLMASDLDWTVVRPGMLTDEPPTGRVAAGPDVPRGPVSRADVSAVLAAVLARPETAGKAFTVVGGDAPIDEAIAAL